MLTNLEHVMLWQQKDIFVASLSNKVKIGENAHDAVKKNV